MREAAGHCFVQVGLPYGPAGDLVTAEDYLRDAFQSMANRFGANVKSSEAIINDKSIDAVLIATSTDTHSDLIEAATAAGKAVLCEKPVDPAPPPIEYIRVSGEL